MHATSEQQLTHLICRVLTLAYSDSKRRRSLRAKATRELGSSLEQYLARMLTRIISEGFSLAAKHRENEWD